MILLIIIPVVCVIGFPIAWLISEFKSTRRTRVILGILAILSATGVAAIVGLLQRLNYNAWYGFASKDLIDTTVVHLEAGETDSVLRELKQLQGKFSPTYEGRAHYNELVDATVQDMKESGQAANKTLDATSQ